MKKTANIYLWDYKMGALAEDDSGRITFEYTPEFIASGINPSPVFVSPQKGRVYEFGQLPYETFKGLPGFVADSLPDKFGTSIINRWLAENGRAPDSYTTIERLLYQGTRSMGALRFEPQIRKDLDKLAKIEIEGLVKAASEVLDNRKALNVNLSLDEEALLTILRVGTSAGGARAKAVVAFNRETGDLLSGQLDVPEGYEHFLLKLDGVYPESPGQLGQTKHFGCIEYAYYKMALDCGIEMTESTLIPDGDRNHFMTKRFDRIGNHRVHMVSLCGMGHLDFNNPVSWSYEQLFGVMRFLHLPASQIEEAYRRMVFNVVGTNQDDHTKNFSFLLDTDKIWKLSPAYDMTYAKGSGYTKQHQMSINGKRLDIKKEDLQAVARQVSISKGKANEIIDRTNEVFSNIESYILPSVPPIMVDEITRNINLLNR